MGWADRGSRAAASGAGGRAGEGGAGGGSYWREKEILPIASERPEHCTYLPKEKKFQSWHC